MPLSRNLWFCLADRAYVIARHPRLVLQAYIISHDSTRLRRCVLQYRTSYLSFPRRSLVEGTFETAMKSKDSLPLVRCDILCPSLPPEVWINVFRFHSDLVHLWTACRRVSSTLRACVEYAFADNFLGDIQIDFQLEKYNLGGKGKRPEVPVRFSRVDQCDKQQVARFVDKRPRSEVCEGRGKAFQKQYDRVMDRWEENVKNWKAELPNYTICIRGLVNDTPLPGLEIDIQKREISFSWREALSLFFGEQEQYRKLKEAWQAQSTAKMKENNVRLAKGEKLMPSDYPQARSTAEAEIRKRVRRWRLKRSYADDDMMLWAIDSLQHFEQYGSASGNAKALKLDPDLPGAGLGERWFGRVNVVQELYLDEWSAMHRIDTKLDRLLDS